MGVGKKRFFFLVGKAQDKKEHYFMILTLTKDKTLSYFVYRAVKIAIFCFALHSALSLGKPCVVHCVSLANSPEEKGFAHDALRDSKGSQKLDRLQSAFSLKIRDCKLRCYYIGIETRRPRFSRQAAWPLACLGFACSNFAKKNKRPLAV